MKPKKMVSKTDKCGLLFGSLVALSFSIVSMTVIGILVNHNSGALLENLVAQTQTDYNVGNSNASVFITSLDQLQVSIQEQNMNCTTANSEYVMTDARLNALSVEQLERNLTNTIQSCLNRTQALEQMVGIVSTELTPITPDVVQSGTYSVTLDGSGSLSGLPYQIKRLNMTFRLTWLSLDPWGATIAVNPSSQPVLRFHDFSPAITNLGICTGLRPIVVQRFSGGVTFRAYELDCSVVGGELRLLADPIVDLGLQLDLEKSLSLFQPFL